MEWWQVPFNQLFVDLTIPFFIVILVFLMWGVVSWIVTRNIIFLGLAHVICLSSAIVLNDAGRIPSLLSTPVVIYCLAWFLLLFIACFKEDIYADTRL